MTKQETSKELTELERMDLFAAKIEKVLKMIKGGENGDGKQRE